MAKRTVVVFGGGVGGQVAARSLRRRLPGRTGWCWSSGSPVSAFRPRISCFVELGDGIAAYASGDFYAEGGPGMNPQAPREDLALEQSGDRAVLAADPSLASSAFGDEVAQLGAAGYDSWFDTTWGS